MLSLCSLCSSRSVVLNFQEQEASKPTGAEYASEAAKEFLDVLEAVAQEIPVPGVGAAVRIATNLIKACEESHATLEEAEELKLQIKMLVTVVVNELKGKKSMEVGEKLKGDIEMLQRELKSIEKILNEIASQQAWLLVFFRNLNGGKVQNCMNRLDSLMDRFIVTRQIDHTILLNRLEKEIIGFYEVQNQILNRIHEGVDSMGTKMDNLGVTMDEMNVTMKDVKAMMQGSSSTAESLSVGPRSSIPANTVIFYGRDALVSELAFNLASTSDGQKHHTCILGPGGMGKTSTALAVMNHPDMKKRYPDSQRVWVPCVKATTGALLLDTLAWSLGITHMTGNVSESILAALKSAGPLVLLLDNFETPWNADDGRTVAEQTLRNIDQIPQITLFITMRSSTPPCAELSWRSINLEAVDAEAALQIYTKIYPESSADTQLLELLELVGYMPLAITLMSMSAKLSGLSAKYLIDQYKDIGPTMLSQGLDREHSMNICISLSVDSLPMKRSPEARWLLAALSMLPAGTSYHMLRKWYARSLSNLTGALQVLREMSLVELKDSTFSVLPVLQRYMLDPSRFDVGVRDSMITSACAFLANHEISPEDCPHRHDDLALGPGREEGNLEAILLQTVVPSAEILDALLVLARYQAAARPRTNTISHALTFAQQMGDKSIHADVLSCYGSIYYNLNLYAESRKYYTDAREIFLSLFNIDQAAQCILACIQSYQVDNTATCATYDSLASLAEAEFNSINNMHGVAQCLLIRGITACSASHYDEGLVLLHQARDKLTEFGDARRLATCSNQIAACRYFQGEFDEARTWSESAVQEFSVLGPSEESEAALMRLGFINEALGNYATAVKMLVRCLERSKHSGRPLITSASLEFIGIAWMQMGRKEDAIGAFQEALEVYPIIPGRNDHLRCGYWLKKAQDTSVIPTREEWEALRLEYPLKALDLYGVKGG